MSARLWQNSAANLIAAPATHRDELTTFPVPKVRDGRSLDCFTDAEFGRQVYATYFKSLGHCQTAHNRTHVSLWLYLYVSRSS